MIRPGFCQSPVTEGKIAALKRHLARWEEVIATEKPPVQVVDSCVGLTIVCQWGLLAEWLVDCGIWKMIVVNDAAHLLILVNKVKDTAKWTTIVWTPPGRNVNQMVA